MSNIEVGEYIRTKKGIIGKVVCVSEGYKFKTTTGHIATGQERYFLDNPKQKGTISRPYVLKHSKNIIDLIEVGDILCIKDNIYEEEYKAEVIEDYDNVICVDNFEANELLELRKAIEEGHITLLGIVTKKQFKEMEYRINE